MCMAIFTVALCKLWPDQCYPKTNISVDFNINLWCLIFCASTIFEFSSWETSQPCCLSAFQSQPLRHSRERNPRTFYLLFSLVWPAGICSSHTVLVVGFSFKHVWCFALFRRLPCWVYTHKVWIWTGPIDIWRKRGCFIFLLTEKWRCDQGGSRKVCLSYSFFWSCFCGCTVRWWSITCLSNVRNSYQWWDSFCFWIIWMWFAVYKITAKSFHV